MLVYNDIDKKKCTYNGGERMKKVIRIIELVINWMFSLICIIALPVFGFHVGSILLFLLGVITLPIRWFVQLRERVHINKFAK